MKEVKSFRCGPVEFYGLANPVQAVCVADKRGEYFYNDQVVVTFHPRREILRVVGRSNGKTYANWHRDVTGLSFGSRPVYLTASYCQAYGG